VAWLSCGPAGGHAAPIPLHAQPHGSIAPPAQGHQPAPLRPFEDCARAVSELRPALLDLLALRRLLAVLLSTDAGSGAPARVSSDRHRRMATHGTLTIRWPLGRWWGLLSIRLRP